MRIISQIRSFLFALLLLSMSAAAFAQIGISISFAPPELPVYEQPICPGDGYLWTPGYWAYANDYDDYYWVPGTWVMAPEVGLLWTPAYWGWGGGGYVFYEGYWGQQVGFYGGVSYGYGYYGDGYQGGRWDNGHFFYNRSVNNVNVTNIHNVYNTTVVENNNRVSFNGGTGGISVRATSQQESIAREKHIPAVAAQTQHAQAARSNPEQRASVNHGKPAVAATPKPGAFSDRAVVPAKAAGAPYNPPEKRAAAQPAAATPAAHPESSTARPAQPSTRPETNRPPTEQPNNRVETSHPAAAQPTARPEPNRNEPSLSGRKHPPPSERSQPERASPPPETRVGTANNTRSRRRGRPKSRSIRTRSRKKTKSRRSNKGQGLKGFKTLD